MGLGLSARVRGHRVRVGRAMWMESQKLEIGPVVQETPRPLRKEQQIEPLCCGRRQSGRTGRLLRRHSSCERGHRAKITRRRPAKARAPLGRQPRSGEESRARGGNRRSRGRSPPGTESRVCEKNAGSGSCCRHGGRRHQRCARPGGSRRGNFDRRQHRRRTRDRRRGVARRRPRTTRKGVPDRRPGHVQVRQNLGIIIVPNAIAIALGALGLIGPPMAAIINNGATCLAVLVGTIPLLKIPARRSPAWRLRARRAGARRPLPVCSMRLPRPSNRWLHRGFLRERMRSRCRRWL